MDFTNINSDMDRLLRDRISKFEADIEKTKRAIAYGRSMRELANDTRWKLVVDALREDGNALWQQFLRKDQKLEDFGRLQGKIEIVQQVIGATSVTDAELERLEAELPDLQNKLQDLYNLV